MGRSASTCFDDSVLSAVPVSGSAFQSAAQEGFRVLSDSTASDPICRHVAGSMGVVNCGCMVGL